MIETFITWPIKTYGVGNDHAHANIPSHVADYFEESVKRASRCYPGAGVDGSAPTGEVSDSYMVDPLTCTPNVDGSEVMTRGNVLCRAGKHSHECYPIDKMSTCSEISLGAKASESKAEDGWADSAKADTPVFMYESTMSEVGGWEPEGMHALTGNFYPAIPADDAEVSDTEKHGLSPEYYEARVDRRNTEPV